MKTSSSPAPPQDPIRAIQKESRQVLYSQPPRFLALFLAFTLPPTAATILYLVFLFPSLLETSYRLYYDQQGHDHNHIVNPSSTTTILVAISCFLFNLIFSSFAIRSITYSVFQGVHAQKINLKSLFGSLATSFLPILSTTLLLQTITTAIVCFISFSIVAAFATLVGFRDLVLVSPFFNTMFTEWILIGVMCAVARVQADWSLATSIAALEPDKWGFESLKLSKSLINSDESLSKLGYKISFVHGIEIFTCYTCLIFIGTNVMDELVLIGVVVLTNSIHMSLVQICHIADNAVFYVHCKDCSVDHDHNNNYVKLDCDDDDDDDVGVVGVDSLV